MHYSTHIPNMVRTFCMLSVTAQGVRGLLPDSIGDNDYFSIILHTYSLLHQHGMVKNGFQISFHWKTENLMSQMDVVFLCDVMCSLIVPVISMKFMVKLSKLTMFARNTCKCTKEMMHFYWSGMHNAPTLVSELCCVTLTPKDIFHLVHHLRPFCPHTQIY